MEISSLENLLVPANANENAGAQTPAQTPGADFFLQLLTAVFPSLVTQMMPNAQQATGTEEAAQSKEAKELEVAQQTESQADPLDTAAVLNYFISLMQPPPPPQPQQIQASLESDDGKEQTQMTQQSQPQTMQSQRLSQLQDQTQTSIEGEMPEQTDQVATQASLMSLTKVFQQPVRENKEKITDPTLQVASTTVKEGQVVAELGNAFLSTGPTGVKIPTAQLKNNVASQGDKVQAVQVLQDFAKLLQDQVNQNMPHLAASRAEPQAATPGYAPTPQPVTSVTIDIPEPGMQSVWNEAVHANIRIYPPELGQVLAKLKINKNVATLTITAENATVKDIIQANLPLLKEQFHQAGLNIQTLTLEVQQQLATTDQHTDLDQQQKPPLLQQEEEINTPRVLGETKEKQNINIDSIIDTYA